MSKNDTFLTPVCPSTLYWENKVVRFETVILTLFCVNFDILDTVLGVLRVVLTEMTKMTRKYTKFSKFRVFLYIYLGQDSMGPQNCQFSQF